MSEVKNSQKLNKMLRQKKIMKAAANLPQICRRCRQYLDNDIKVLEEEIECFCDNNLGVIV